MSNTKDPEQKKKEAYEDIDYLKQIDRAPNDEVARKFVIDVEKDKQAKEKEVKDATKNVLEGKGLFTYLNRLATYAQAGLESIDWPNGWERSAVPTDSRGIRIYGTWFNSQQGVLIIVKSPKGEVYVRGIRTCMNADMDVNAIDILVLQAENTLDSAKGLLLDGKDTVSGLRKTKSGIILPD